jgi:Cdc6-like AAA superfamily ATPase
VLPHRLRKELKSIYIILSIISFFRNERFVGRESELAEVKIKLFTSKQTTKIIITGEEETGKSQLALEFIYKIRRENKNYLVF